MTYAMGFFIASGVQALVVYLALVGNLSNFDPGFTPGRLVFHFLVGQVAGFTFAYVIRENLIGLGILTGLLFWGLIIAWLGPAVGYIPSVFALGWRAIVTTLVAFVIYGSILGYTVSLSRERV